LRQWTVDVRRLVTVLSAAVGTGQSADELIRESAWQLGTIDIAGESFDVTFVRMGGPAHEPALDELPRKHPPARTIFDSFGRRCPRAASGVQRSTRRAAAGRVRRRWQPLFHQAEVTLNSAAFLKRTCDRAWLMKKGLEAPAWRFSAEQKRDQGHWP
jgi:hypothetical protein